MTRKIRAQNDRVCIGGCRASIDGTEDDCCTAYGYAGTVLVRRSLRDDASSAL